VVCMVLRIGVVLEMRMAVEGAVDTDERGVGCVAGLYGGTGNCGWGSCCWLRFPN
jgi:hypothetical protein